MVQKQTNRTKIDVLITAASRRVSLVRFFRVAVEACGGSLITVDYEPDSAALFFSHRHYKVPLVLEPDYLPTIEKICRKENISLLIPSIDQELLLWAKNKQTFKEKGVHVSISPAKTIQICNDKWETFQFFKSHRIPFPDSYLKEDLPESVEFPLFIKPRDGRGSVHTYMAENPKHLAFFLDYVPNPIVQTYLKGDEFTVDAFFDQNHTLVSYVPRYRLVVRSGVSDKGRTFRNEKLGEWIDVIGKKMKFEGAINIQGKIDGEDITFFEINPRFSGGIQLSTAAGPNFAQFLVHEQLGEKQVPQLGEYSDNLTMTSYEDSLFLDQQRNLSCFSNLYPHILPAKNKSVI